MKTLLLKMFQSLKKVPSTLISSHFRFTKLPVSFFAIIFLFLSGNAVGQCTNCNSNFPGGTFSTTSSTWSNVSSIIYAGEYAYYNVSLGSTYQWQTCGGASYDTQLTLRQGSDCSGTFIAYNDDYCSTQSQITWTATFTGTVTVLLSQYNCANNSTSTTVQWRCSNYVPPCTAPTAFTLTGGGTCLSGPLAVGLSGSQTGVNYQLKKNGVNEGAPVAGTGSAISFGNQTTGTYTVEASGSGYCTVTFVSSVSISLNPLSLPNTITLCPSSTTTLSVVGEANSSGTNYTTTYNSLNGTMQTVFTGNGTFVNGSGTAITAKSLLVGGGGGGGARHGGGGGGGGVLYNAAMSIPAGNLPVVIGAGGGAGDYQNNVNHGNGRGAGGNGGNTTFNGSTAYGGGGGKTYDSWTNAGATIASGGGGAGNSNTTYGNGQAAGSQGNVGGNGPGNTNGNAGGGGGAGAAGGTASGNNGGNGGNGSNQSANFGTSVGQNGWFGGGGGGGSRGNSTTCGTTGGTAGTGGVGGNGGGGRGGDRGNHTNGSAGLANTGGGGGGNRSCNTTTNFAGFAGGSGVVILNYPAGVWSSSNTAVATVSQSGLVSVLSGAMAGQSAVITYTSVSGCSVTTTVLVSSNSAPIAIETANNLCSGTVTLSTTTPKPIAHYTFDGTLNDISGNGLHLTPISGTATYTENGLVLSGGGAMRFDSPSNSLLSNAVDYTIEFDFKQTAADGSYGKIFTWAPNGNRSPGIFHLPGGTNTGFHWRHDSDLNPCCGGNAGVNYQAGIALNQWYHVVGVRKGTRFELYVDGILVDSANDLPTDGRAGSAPFVFGAFPGNPAPAGTIIKNFKVFNNALEWYTGSCGGTFVSSEPSPIVNPASTSTYYVRNRNVCGTSSCTPIIVNRGPIPAVPTVSAGTPSICGSGTTTLVASGMAPGGQVFQGNGTNAHIDVAQTFMPETNFSIEMWVKTAASNTGIFCVTEASPPAVGGHDRHLYVYGGKLWVRVWPGAGWNTGYTLNDNLWHHISLVVETGVGQKVYVDGRLVATFEFDHSDFNWDTRVLIGYSEDLALAGLPANNWFNGSIDNVRIWNVARTQQQLINNMNLENATGTGLVAHYPLNGNANALVGPNGTVQGGTTWVVPTYYTYTWAGGPSLPAASTNESQTTGTISTNGTYNYTVTASAGSCPGNTSASVPVVVTSPVGNPAVFGTNVWNVYGYNGNSTTIASNTYRGNYIQPALGGGNEGIATQNFWGNGNSPSNAGTTLDNGNLWNGCSVNADNHTFVHKRRGFPCGTYTFTMNDWDDETRIIINGVNVWSCGVWSGNPGGYSNSTSATYSCVSGPTFTFQLDANSEVEIQVFEGAGLSNLGVDIIKVVPPSLAGNVSRMCPTSGSAFIDFTDATGRLIASVNPNSNNLGNVTITSYVGTPAVMNACAQPSNPLFSTVYMGRTWVMTSSAYPNGANFPSNVTVRLPFNNTELAALNTAADASTTGNPNDGGITIPATLANLMLTKITGATENGVANAADCASTILAITSSPASGTDYLSITNTSYKDFNVGQFSEFFLHKNNAGMPLPVELISFSGTCTEKGTELTWQTASESNNDYFLVQRSRDGQNWEDLTIVSGNGNSTQLINYDWLDEAGFGGMYYRLTQVDFNGDRYEKQAIFVNCESESTKLHVYPNPTQADFTVEVNSTKEVESATISIIDVTGKALVHRNVEIHSGVNTFNFGDQLESGTYLIRVSIEGEIQTLRLVVK